MNTKLNEIEEKALTEIDVWTNELDNTALTAVYMGVSADAIASYIRAETNTICERVRRGQVRTFDEIYAEFIDELIRNGRYFEYEDFLKHERTKYLGE